MKKTPLLAVMAAGVLSLCFALPQVTAQGTAPARQPGMAAPNGFAGKTVLLDVNYVFKNHVRFKQFMNQLKNDADKMDIEMKKAEGQLREMAMGLQKFTAGSPEYKQLEENVARTKTEWTIKVQQQRREFLMREAKIYNDTYQEIENEVNYFCESNGILMVLRFMGDPVEEANPESILANINKPVVWYNKNLDITPIIMQRFAGPGGPNATADRSNAPRGGAQPNYQPPRNTVPQSPFGQQK